MPGPPAEVTRTALACGVATDDDASQKAARDAARGPALDEDFLAIVRALAKRHAREDYAAEVARNASHLSIKAEQP